MTLFLLLVANFLASILYAFIKGIHRDEAWKICLFIFLPYFGFLIYYMPQIIQMFLELVGIDREAILTHVFDIERQPEHPNVQEALNVAPVEDVLAVGDNTEKRSLLLKQMRKDLKDNYKILLVAEQDEDSESAHYVAATKMEIYRLNQTQWLECRRDYEKDPDNPEKFHTTCEILKEMISSGVLSSREQKTYQKRLCDIIKEKIDAGWDEVYLEEYEEYLYSLVELEQYSVAENLWKEHALQMRSETSYHYMLKMFYKMGEKQKFQDILDDLCKNKQVRLSSKGLEQLRYWMNRLDK